MVHLSEKMASVFWGVTLTTGKKYTQKVVRTFRLSMAALDHGEGVAHSDKPVSVMIQHDKASFLLCTLQYGKLFQQILDLTFLEDEEITFYLNGQGTVHLTGYVMEDESDFDPNALDSDVEDISEGDVSNSNDDSDDIESSGSKLKQVLSRKRKAARLNESTTADDDDDDDEDDDFDASNFLDDEAEDSFGDGEEHDSDSDSDDDSEAVASPNKKRKEESPKKKKVKLNESGSVNTPEKTNGKKSASASANTSASQSDKSALADDGEKKKKKKKKNKKNKNQPEASTSTSDKSPAQAAAATPTPAASKGSQKRILEGGVHVVDTKEGHGPTAKAGKKVTVFYSGRLLNGKMFDSKTSGKGFQFKLGKKEVINGWDVGVAGMKVGGKRSITVPPSMGYGTQKLPGIPANSTLVFDVELRAVN